MGRIVKWVVFVVLGIAGATLVFIAVARAEGDAAAGEAIYERCMGCHSIERNRVGPRHMGLFGRKAGSLPDFDYSEAMKNSGLTWDADTLDEFLKNPRKLVPGTKMGFSGVPDDRERGDLIAYLKIATQPAK